MYYNFKNHDGTLCTKKPSQFNISTLQCFKNDPLVQRPIMVMNHVLFKLFELQNPSN